MAILFLNSPRGLAHPRRRGLLRPHSGPHPSRGGGVEGGGARSLWSLGAAYAFLGIASLYSTIHTVHKAEQLLFSRFSP